jgi:nucleotide-binding universal stress UspA family protein
MFRKTLVCLDGSKLAEEVLPHLRESCSIYDSEVIMLYVSRSDLIIPAPQSIHAYTLGRESSPGAASVSDIGETSTVEAQVGVELKNIEREQSDARRYLDDLARPFRARGIKVKTVILEGDVADTILEYARSNNVSLIALTTHGSSGLKRSLLGRVAQAILKEAGTPVLIIKPRGAVS